MQQNHQSRVIIAGGFLLLVIVAGYFFFAGGDKAPVYSKKDSSTHYTTPHSTHSTTPHSSSSSSSPLSCTDLEKSFLESAAGLLNAKVFEISGKKTDKVFQGMGHIGQAMPEFHYYYSVAKNRTWVKNVCEVGFNAGHSALAFLLGRPDITYVAFDTMGVQWTTPMITFMNDAFQNRIIPVKGYSAQSVPEWKPEEGFTGCDIISADGKHTAPEPYLDIVNLAKHAKTGASVLSDDWSDNFPDVKAAWQRLKDEGIIKEVACIVSGVVSQGFAKNFCHGILVKGGYPADPANVEAKELGLL